jgi:3-hexulose-6-phosphate synthase
MKLQVSVDLVSLEQALNLLAEVAPYVDIIEAGTPLIKQEGLQVVTIFKQAYPDKLIFADMKTMDAGELKAELAFQAGSDITTVLAIANDATITGVTGADVAAIGGAIYHASSPGAMARQLREQISPNTLGIL